VSDLIERGKAIAGDAMGMEPEDRHTVTQLIERIAELEAEDKRLTMMLAEYVRLDNAGLIPMRPVAALKGDSDG